MSSAAASCVTAVSSWGFTKNKYTAYTLQYKTTDSNVFQGSLSKLHVRDQ